MNRKVFTQVLILFLLVNHLAAQSYVDWINPNQKYFRFKVVEEGIYRISFNELVSSGFLAAHPGLDPTKIQLFRKGVEQAIFINGEADRTFNSEDYIEFYGLPNDGAEDAELYLTASNQINQKVSLFTDSAAYFLTVISGAGTGTRMEEVLPGSSIGLSPETECSVTTTQLYYSQYSQGRERGSQIRTTQYDEGEGWVGPQISGAGSTIVLDGLEGLVNSSSLRSSLFVRLVGGRDVGQEVSVQVGASESNLRIAATMNGTRRLPYERETTLSSIDFGLNEDITVKLFNISGLSYLSELTLTYPRNLDFSSNADHKFTLKANTSDRSLLRLTNQSSSDFLVDVTDPVNPRRINLFTPTQGLSAIVSNTSTSRTMYLAGTRKSVNSIIEFDLSVPVASTSDYLIITHPQLSDDDFPGGNPVTSYADYRESMDGGNYNSLVLLAQDVYNIFNYGDPTPVAIRRFARHMYEDNVTKYIFIIGIGATTRHLKLSGQPRDISTSIRSFHPNLIPTWGDPGSDVPFTVGLDPDENPLSESIPVGRINAKSPEDVKRYLSKVQQMESLPFDDLWRKNLVHLSGGKDNREQDRFRSYINQMEVVAETGLLGGEVSSISKTNFDAVQLLNIADEVNSGLSLITFFGHSTAATSDIAIGKVSRVELGYNNPGRYPTFLVSGCNAGNFYEPADQEILTTFGEDWILAPDLGAIGFMAHSYFGKEIALRDYAFTFYDVAFGSESFFGRTLGQIRQETQRRFLGTQTTIEANSVQATQAQQMILQGDPAVRLFGTERPEFEAKTEEIQLSGAGSFELDANLDSINISFTIRNYGRVNTKPVSLTVTRGFADGSEILYGPFEVGTVVRQREVSFNLANPSDRSSAGLNTFAVELDPGDSIPEADDFNNIVQVEVDIPSGSVINLLPENQAIVNDKTVGLVVQASNLLTKNRIAIVEVSRSENFLNPARFEVSLDPFGIVSIDLEDLQADVEGGTVYWRSRFETPLANENNEWQVSSFSFSQNLGLGWGQLVKSEMRDNELVGVSLSNDVWEFEPNTLNVHVKTQGAGLSPELSDNILTINSVNYLIGDFENCVLNTLNIIEFERSSLQPIAPDYRALFGSPFDILIDQVCGPRAQVVFNLRRADLVEGNQLLNNIYNASDSANIFVVFSLGNFDFDNVSSQNLDILTQMGISRTTLSEHEAGEPFIFVGRHQAAPGSAIEIIGIDNNSEVEFNQALEGLLNAASMETDLIGPAREWTSLNIDLTSGIGDVSNFTVTGLTAERQDTVLFESYNIAVDNLATIDASRVPFLKLGYSFSDRTNGSAPQLNAWNIEYEPLPEGVLYPADTNISELSLVEGQSRVQRLIFRNVSGSDFRDSVEIESNIFNKTSFSSEVNRFKIAPPAANDSSSFEVAINSRGKVGQNDLTVSAEAEIELTQTNNSLRLANFLNVQGDVTNPVLDVTFDGAYILDNDIVSPDPNILITLDDENEFLPKNDTIGVNIFFKNNDDSLDFQRVSLSDPSIIWTPATEESNFEVNYTPGKLEDGSYALRVTATDQSGNAAGSEPYEINFNVINESSISNFLPYPNPFSTSTQFVFTLTGEVVPERIMIQIFTIRGTLVKTIRETELGSIRVGHNITDYRWDGRDEYGDLLANGVYLYKVSYSQDSDGQFSQFETAADKAFTKGFGKLYILR